jgi:hypothetical protein
MIVWRGEHPATVKQAPKVKPYLHGWLGHGNKRILHQLLALDRPHTVIELGSWYGKSAEMLIRNQHRPERLFCVDLWSESDIFTDRQVIKPHHPVRHQGTQGTVADTIHQHPLWETFVVNLWPHRDRVLAVQQDSLTGLNTIFTYLSERGEVSQVGMIYIDADHRYDAVCAEILLAHQLFPEARLVGDDYTAHRPVRRAVDQMAEQLGFNVVTDHNCWYYQ